MKKILFAVLLLAGCAHADAEQYEQGKKIEVKMNQYVESALDTKNEGAVLLLPFDPIGDKIDNLPDNDYSKALEKAWVNATIEHDFEEANKFLNKAKDIRTGQ